MTDSIALQSDIPTSVSTGLESLAKFSGLLATITADNVAPIAVLQVQQLGTMFHLNGPLAERVPDVLARCQSYRLERFALSIGWRKGDTASLLADSAGGQAAAMLVLGLSSMFNTSSCAKALQYLSANLLPKGSCIASPTQLAQVVPLITGKMSILGYGQHLAKHVTRIRQVYFELGMDAGTLHLKQLPVEYVVNIMAMVSSAMSEEGTVARFKGAIGMGHMLALLMAMCPQDCLVTVEDFIIHEGTRRKIILHIESSGGIASRLEHQHSDSHLPLQRIDHTYELNGWNEHLRLPRYSWRKWIACRLQLYFNSENYDCSEKIKLACCEVILQRYWGYLTHVQKWSSNNPSDLMPYDLLEEMFGIRPAFNSSSDYDSAVENLRNSVQDSIQCKKMCYNAFQLPNLDESMAQERPGPFKSPGGNALGCRLEFITCNHQILWGALAIAILDGFAGLWIRYLPETTVPACFYSVPSCGNSKHRSQLDCERTTSNQYLPCNLYCNSPLAKMVFSPTSDLSFGDSSSIMYIGLLCDLGKIQQQHLLWHLADGHFVINNRYYQLIESEDAGEMELPFLEVDFSNSFTCSSESVPEDVKISSYEDVDKIKLIVELRFGGRLNTIHLGRVITRLRSVTISIPCAHNRAAPLRDLHRYKVGIVKSMPQKLAILMGAQREIAMLKGDPLAQLFYMTDDCLLQGETCLQCLWDQAVKVNGNIRFRRIIVT
jgi:hypothetical protein